MMWLIFLGLAVGLVIALRRVLRRQGPLSEALSSKTVAVDHVQSGVGWVAGDAKFGSVNQSFAKAFDMTPADFAGREWYKVFAESEQPHVRECYSEMMLKGIISFATQGDRSDGSKVWLNVWLVAVYDHHARFVGHYCLIEDKTRERELQDQVAALRERVAAESVVALDREVGRSVSGAIKHEQRPAAPQTQSPPVEVR
jgi:PAS domain S-box-containing protein